MECCANALNNCAVVLFCFRDMLSLWDTVKLNFVVVQDVVGQCEKFVVASDLCDGVASLVEGTNFAIVKADKASILDGGINGSQNW